MLITFIVSLVLLPVTSAYLLVSSLLPPAPMAYTGLPLALPFPPSGCVSQSPMPVTPRPIHGLWHCFRLIFCHLLLYLLFQFFLPLLGSPPHLHHCLLSFCPLFLSIISSLSLAASSPHLLLTPRSHLSLHCPISPSPLPYSFQYLSPQHCAISFYCLTCYFPVPLSPSPMVPWLCPALCHTPPTSLCLSLLSLLLTALFSAMSCYCNSLLVLAHPICYLFPLLLLLFSQQPCLLSTHTIFVYCSTCCLLLLPK